jgi:eukaryotic-like serine/threonine-protein kinase
MTGAGMFTCRACGDTHPSGTAVCPRLEEPTHPGNGPCGTQIDRYFVERLLGGGGMGAVYRARHVMLEQPVALKLLRPGLAGSRDMMERFVREARAAASIGNPHIVRVSDFGVTPDGRAFLAMELLEGQDLDSLLKAERAMPVPRAVHILGQVLDGLGAAHAAGIVHRDMKPANVFLLRDDFVKLVDFGVSKMRGAGTPASSSLTQTGTVMGTPLYMAPEQFKGARDVDARADLYAVGVTLYQMLSGTVPYDAPTYESLVLQIYTEPPRPIRQVAPGISEAMAQVVDRSMAREPERRFQSAAELATALAAAAHGVGPAAAVAPAAGGDLATLPRGGTLGVGAAAPPTPPGATPVPVAVRESAIATAPVKRKGRRGLVIGTVGVALLGVLVAVAAVLGQRGAGGNTASLPPPPTGMAGSPAASSVPLPPPPPSPPPPPPPPPPGVPAPAAIPSTAAAPPTPPVARANRSAADDDETDEDRPPAVPAAPSARPPATPAAPPKPGHDVSDIRAEEPEVVGHLSPAPLRDAFKRARAQLDDCRPQSGTAKVRVVFLVNTQRIAIAKPDDLEPGDPAVARCVAARIKETEPAWPPDVSGVMRMNVILPAAK